MGPDRDGARQRDGTARRQRRRHRAARHRQGLPRHDRGTPMGVRRLPLDARGVDPALRGSERSLRAPPPLHDRCHLVRRRVADLRDCAEHRVADSSAGAARCRRRAADARKPRHSRGIVCTWRTRTRDRGMVRPRRRRDRPGTIRGRIPHLRHLLAADLPDQRPDRRGGDLDHDPARPRVPAIPTRPGTSTSPGAG